MRRGIRAGFAVFWGLLLTPAVARAHPLDYALTPQNGWRAWTLEPAVVILLALSAAGYAIGAARLKRDAGGGRRLGPLEITAFAGGWAAVLVALVSPLDALGDVLFSAHMVQHELLMLVAAPLVVLGSPFTAFRRLVPAGRLRAPVPAFAGRCDRALATLTAPAAAWLLHAIAIWTWHAPRLFDAAVRSDIVHAAQHASFFGTAVLFWWGLVRGRDGRIGYGAAVVYVFTTTIHTGLLGALLTISPVAWYRVYATTTAPFGLTPLEDQQLGGLIMWVPASVIYTAIGLALFAMWLRESERRVDLAGLGGAREPASAKRTSPVGPLVVLVVATSTLAACGFRDTHAAAIAMTGGDPARGKQALADYGCVTCHTIPGIREARALVGPPLAQVASRVYLAGHLPNTPDNMMLWIRHPREQEPHTVMPDTGVTEADARDIAAYLYTLR